MTAGGYWGLAASDDGDTGLFELRIGKKSEVTLGDLSVVGIDDGFHPYGLAVHDGRLVLVGAREVEGEHMSNSPRFEELEREDFQAALRLSAWEMVGYEEWSSTTELAAAAYLVDSSGGATDLGVPTFGNRFGACVAASANPDGTLRILQGGSSLPEAAYVDRLGLATKGASWSTETVASGLGESGNHALSHDETGDPVVLMTPQAGGVRVWTPRAGTRELEPRGYLVGAGPSTDGRLLVASANTQGHLAIDAMSDRARGFTVSPRDDIAGRLTRVAPAQREPIEKAPTFVPVESGRGEFIVGTRDGGLRLEVL